MVNIDYYTSVGYALELLARSESHRDHILGDCFRIEILPALRCGQIRFYVTPEGVPTGLVTWAWLSKAVEHEMHTTSRALNEDEWNCGDRLFFNDWITPYDNIREVVADMKRNVFPEHSATSVRRNPDGTVRAVKYWRSTNSTSKLESAFR